MKLVAKVSLRKECPYCELFWSSFSRIRTAYGEIRGISLYSVRMRENTDQNNSEYGHFSRNVLYPSLLCIVKAIYDIYSSLYIFDGPLQRFHWNIDNPCLLARSAGNLNFVVSRIQTRFLYSDVFSGSRLKFISINNLTLITWENFDVGSKRMKK